MGENEFFTSQADIITRARTKELYYDNLAGLSGNMLISKFLSSALSEWELMSSRGGELLELLDNPAVRVNLGDELVEDLKKKGSLELAFFLFVIHYATTVLHKLDEENLKKEENNANS